MTRGRKALIGGGVVFAGLIVLVIAHPSKPISVEVAPVERGTVEDRVSSSASGDVEPKARAVLRAETVARVTKLLAKAGDRVESGAVLLKLDDQALAAAVAAARVQNETAQRDAQTADAMQKKGIITEQALLGARSAADLAHANLSLAEANLARATVRAPFGGLVTRLPVQEGDSVIVGQSLAEVVDDSALYVRAAFDEVDAVRVRLGQEAMGRLDAYPDDPLPATVDRIDPVVGGDTISGGSAADAVALSAGKKDRTVGVRIAIAPGATLPDGGKILVGMSADVEVVLSRHEGVLRVPSAAIFHEKGQQFAYVLEGGRLRRRTVVTGTSNWEFQEVKDGLVEGERVLVSLEAEGIKNGARAVPKPAVPSPTSVGQAR